MRVKTFLDKNLVKEDFCKWYTIFHRKWQLIFHSFQSNITLWYTLSRRWRKDDWLDGLWKNPRIQKKRTQEESGCKKIEGWLQNYSKILGYVPNRIRWSRTSFLKATKEGWWIQRFCGGMPNKIPGYVGSSGLWLD